MAHYEINIDSLRYDDAAYDAGFDSDVELAIDELADRDRVTIVATNDETIVVAIDENDPIAIAQLVEFAGLDELDELTRIA